MKAVAVELGGPASLVICCEHAMHRLPEPIGATPALLDSHRGWDPGALQLARMLLGQLGGQLVYSGYSRLYVDLNRAPESLDCIPLTVDGTVLPGNQLTSLARSERLARVHDQYHNRLDRVLSQAVRCWGRSNVFLLSVHTYTAVLDTERRTFEAGVLFDDHDPLAETLHDELLLAGLDARLNEPYSGYAGLIYSARRHGQRHRVRYLELEVRNDCLETQWLSRTGASVIQALRATLTPVALLQTR